MHFIRENLAVCGYHHIGNRETFLSHRFGAQLQCTGSYDAWLPECVEVLALPFHDGMPVPPDLFHRAQDWLAAHWDVKAKILISCAAGQSRSVTMAIAHGRALRERTEAAALSVVDGIDTRRRGGPSHGLRDFSLARLQRAASA